MLFWKCSVKQSPKCFYPLSIIDQPTVFETLRVYGRCIAAWEEHLRRLNESAHTLQIVNPWSNVQWTAWVRKKFLKIQGQNFILRLMLSHTAESGAISVLIVKRFVDYPKRMYSNGIHIQCSSVRADSIKAHYSALKANGYVTRVLSYLALDTKVAQDHYFLNAEGIITEGSVSNLFIIKGKELWTPHPACGILMGVTRRIVLEAAAFLGLRCHESFLTRHDLYVANEVFLTNTSMEVLPVTRVDGRLIGGGRAGKIAPELRQQLKRNILNRGLEV